MRKSPGKGSGLLHEGCLGGSPSNEETLQGRLRREEENSQLLGHAAGQMPDPGQGLGGPQLLLLLDFEQSGPDRRRADRLPLAAVGGN